MIVLAVNERRSPAESTNGNAASVARRRLRRELRRARRAARGAPAWILPSVPSRRCQAFVRLVDGEHHAGRAGEDRRRRARSPPRRLVAVEAGARDAAGSGHRARCARPAQRRGRRRAVGQRRPERAVEQHRRDRAEARASAAARARNARRVRAAAALGGVAQRREVGLGERAERLAQAGVDLGLGSRRAGRRVEQPGGAGGSSWREIEVEERRLRLLELRRRRQHVVREPRRLGHRHVDHDERVERARAPRACAASRRASAPGCRPRRSSRDSASGGR